MHLRGLATTPLLIALQSLLAAFAKLVVRQIRGAVAADVMVLSLSAVATLLAAAGCAVAGSVQMPQTPAQWGLLAGTGLTGGGCPPPAAYLPLNPAPGPAAHL